MFRSIMFVLWLTHQIPPEAYLCVSYIFMLFITLNYTKKKKKIEDVYSQHLSCNVHRGHYLAQLQ